MRSRGCNWPKVRDSVLGFFFFFYLPRPVEAFSGGIIAELDVWFKKENKSARKQCPQLKVLSTRLNTQHQ